MNCATYRELHPARTPEAEAHLASCVDCRAFAEVWEKLGEYPPIEPKATFFEGVRRKLAPRILRFAAPLAAAAAAILVAAVVLLQSTPPPAVTDEERELVENLDLLENYDLLKTLEIVGDTSSPLLEEKK